MHARRAFTLIELLVVISILALLMGIAVSQYGKFMGTGDRAATVSRLEGLKGLLETYRTAKGDYPKATLASLGVRSANSIDEGNEAMVLALFAKDYDGQRIDEKWLTNADDDTADKNLSIFDRPVLMEVVDAFGNPFVYLRPDVYEKGQEYEITDTGTQETNRVRAVGQKNEETGGFYAKESYQLWSAGEDGVLGTEDDIASFR